MSNKEVVETRYGDHSRYDVVAITGPLGGVKYYVNRDGKAWKGSFSSLRAAVEAAEEGSGARR